MARKLKNVETEKQALYDPEYPRKLKIMDLCVSFSTFFTFLALFQV